MIRASLRENNIDASLDRGKQAHVCYKFIEASARPVARERLKLLAVYTFCLYVSGMSHTRDPNIPRAYRICRVTRVSRAVTRVPL